MKIEKGSVYDDDGKHLGLAIDVKENYPEISGQVEQLEAELIEEEE